MCSSDLRVAVGTTETAGKEGLGRGLLEQFPQLIHAGGAHHLGMHRPCSAPTAERLGFSGEASGEEKGHGEEARGGEQRPRLHCPAGEWAAVLSFSTGECSRGKRLSQTAGQHRGRTLHRTAGGNFRQTDAWSEPLHSPTR